MLGIFKIMMTTPGKIEKKHNAPISAIRAKALHLDLSEDASKKSHLIDSQLKERNED